MLQQGYPSAATPQEDKMNRRLILALPIQVALAAEGIATGVHAQIPQAAPNPLDRDQYGRLEMGV
jgi:hypothetical protein